MDIYEPEAAKKEAMNAVHLIRAEGPLIIFGGPYGNLEATQAMLGEAARLGVPAERTICTGDVVAYGADPAATVALVRAGGCPVVMGNCEESLAAGADDCSCGFPAGIACERLSAAWYSHATRELSGDAIEWMASLPRRIDVQVGTYRFAVVHGGVARINRFIFASTDAAIKDEELGKAVVDGLIAGHCGLPFTQVLGERLWHNPGVIGMPANDGTPRVWYSLLVPQPGGISIEHRAIEYDFRTAAKKMRYAGLPQEYAAALETGTWPTCDVLPWKEIRERGVRLEEGRVFWRQPASKTGKRPASLRQLWPPVDRDAVPRLDPRKFKDPRITMTGAPRASVALRQLETLWFNTGTLCNIACRNCYIESSPRNDRLVYLSRSDVRSYLDEIERDRWNTEEIGFTGGEPFMNPDFLGMLEDCLSRGYRALVLTNAMRPMQRSKSKLIDLKDRLGQKLIIRVSLDHFTPERHEDERGPDTFKPTLDGLIWLAREGFKVAVAGRTMWAEHRETERAGYARLFAQHGIPIDAYDPSALVLFPEMDSRADVPEIGEACWDILGKSPDDVMCASSRMIVKRKDAERPTVLACTLIPYDEQFELGPTLKSATRPVLLNHPNCAKFCVLGGASCSAQPSRHDPAIQSGKSAGRPGEISHAGEPVYAIAGR
jgi:sulfatase maturation enzyme AslB (radical SAM superfamily)/predicted phosphodiesterase